MRWRSICAGAVLAMGCGPAPAQQPVETHHASLMVQTGQSESVTSLAFSPDAHYAVVAGAGRQTAPRCAPPATWPCM
jgi:hypothetical protein